MRPIGSPFSGTGRSAGAVTGGVVDGLVGGSSVVVWRCRGGELVGELALRRSWACWVARPVPQSWYATKSSTSTPARIMKRPIAPMTRHHCTAGTLATGGGGVRSGRSREGPAGSRGRLLRARPAWSGGRPDGYPRATPWRSNTPTARPGRRPWSTSGARWRCSAASPPSPASTSTSTAGASCCSAARTARARPPSCAPSPAWCPVTEGTADRARGRPGRRPQGRAAPGGPARPRHRPLRGPHRRRQRALLGPGGQGRPGRRRRGHDQPRARRPPAPRHRRPALHRSAPAHLARLPHRPPPRAVAARRAPRRARPGRPRPRRRAGPRRHQPPAPP